MSDCAPQYDSAIDPPDSFYGFTLAEWSAAGQRSGGEAAYVVASWPAIMESVQAGGLVGMGLAAFVDLARLGPEYAARVVTRLGAAFSRDTQALAAALAAGVSGEGGLARFDPALPQVRGPQRAQRIRDLHEELALAQEIIRLATPACAP